jgi:hypothetical protein
MGERNITVDWHLASATTSIEGLSTGTAYTNPEDMKATTPPRRAIPYPISMGNFSAQRVTFPSAKVNGHMGVGRGRRRGSVST